MSLERIIMVLEDFGLGRVDAEIYVFLSKKGPKTVKDLCYALKLTKSRLYRILKRLQNQNMVSASIQRPAVFSAVPLEQVLDSIIKAKIEEAQKMKSTKESFIN